jgi:hypothetical protein
MILHDAKSRAITRGPKFHWFGYYDKLQFDPTGRYVLGMAVDFEHRNPTPDDVIEVGMVDLHDGDSWIPLGESRAWCWQQGCHLQWRPGSDREVLWNDRRDGRFVAVVLDVRTGATRLLPHPIDNLSPDGRLALGVDFARIHGFRAGYGYAGVPDPRRDDPAPADSGVYAMDLDTGAWHMLVTCAQVAALAPAHPAAGPQTRHYINHVQWNPNGRRFLFLNRPQTRLWTADADGGDLRMVMFDASHYVWRDPEHILVWANGAYRLYRDRPMDPGQVLWEAPNGHESYLPDRDWVITDTYPKNSDTQRLYLRHLRSGQEVTLGEFVSPVAYRGEWRCDLHPRLTPDGRQVCFDSPHGGNGRQMYLLELDDEGNPS